MKIEIVSLNPDLLGKLLTPCPRSLSLMAPQLQAAYFSPGSTSLCLLADGEPVFAGGVVNMQWNRGEAWILPTPFFRTHLKTCLRSLKAYLSIIALDCGFRRIQATCVGHASDRLFASLGFEYEGLMRNFGPSGENCQMWSRVFKI
jgi:hypothetical protein